MISSKHQGISTIFTSGKTSQHHGYTWGENAKEAAPVHHHFKSLVQAWSLGFLFGTMQQFLNISMHVPVLKGLPDFLVMYPTVQPWLAINGGAICSFLRGPWNKPTIPFPEPQKPGWLVSSRTEDDANPTVTLVKQTDQTHAFLEQPWTKEFLQEIYLSIYIYIYIHQNLPTLWMNSQNHSFSSPVFSPGSPCDTAACCFRCRRARRSSARSCWGDGDGTFKLWILYKSW